MAEGHRAGDLEALGGRAGVAAIVRDFVGRVFDDLIIGFFFVDSDRERIVRRETELALAHLGDDVIYGGRPLGQVHKPRRINRGQFRRRLAILRRTLEDHGAPEDVIERWIGREARLIDVITDGTDCVEE